MVSWSDKRGRVSVFAWAVIIFFGLAALTLIGLASYQTHETIESDNGDDIPPALPPPIIMSQSAGASSSSSSGVSKQDVQSLLDAFGTKLLSLLNAKLGSGATTSAADISASSPPSATVLVSDPQGNCPLGYAVTSSDTMADVAFVGTGPGNMFAAYYLVKYLKSAKQTLRIVMIDNRPLVGGKVQSEAAPNSTPKNPLFTPTCAEQVRTDDTDLRCMAQELGITGWVRAGTNTFENYWRGYNITAPDTTLASQAAFDLPEPFLAPNGPASTQATQMNGIDFCANPTCSGQPAGDWTVCSNWIEALCRITGDDPTNATFTSQFPMHQDYVLSRMDRETYTSWEEGLYSDESWRIDRGANQMEYLNYDWNVGHGPQVTVIKGGPQQIYLAMQTMMQKSGMVTFYQQETVNCLDKGTSPSASTYPYVLRTGVRNVQAKRVMLGTPSGQFIRLMKGGLGLQLAQSEALRATGNMTMASTVNMFFPYKWWIPYRTQPNRIGWAQSTAPLGGITIANGIQQILDNYRNYPQWSFFGDTKGGFFTDLIQYLPTPERAQANLLRSFHDEERARHLRTIYNMQGAQGLQAWIMGQIRQTMSDIPNIPDPTKIVYHFEEFGYSRVDPYTTLSNTDLRNFAKTPLPGELISFSTESFNYMNWGWQQGSVDMAKQAFQAGGALAGLVPQAVQNNWGTCASTNSLQYDQGKVLSRNDPVSTNDGCLLLGNEVNMRDLMTTVGRYKNLYSKACYDQANKIPYSANAKKRSALGGSGEKYRSDETSFRRAGGLA
jgi:hypothetical protein